MNILILTAFTKNVVWNNYGDCDFGKFAAEINLKYANKNNFYVCQVSVRKNNGYSILIV